MGLFLSRIIGAGDGNIKFNHPQQVNNIAISIADVRNNPEQRAYLNSNTTGSEVTSASASCFDLYPTLFSSHHSYSSSEKLKNFDVQNNITRKAGDKRLFKLRGEAKIIFWNAFAGEKIKKKILYGLKSDFHITDFDKDDEKSLYYKCETEEAVYEKVEKMLSEKISYRDYKSNLKLQDTLFSLKKLGFPFCFLIDLFFRKGFKGVQKLHECCIGER